MSPSTQPTGIDTPDPRETLRARLAAVPVPTWAVYALGGFLVALALVLPWLAQSCGVLAHEAPEAQAPQALRPAMIELPGGTFVMGSDDGDTDEQPVHTVTVSRFQLCRTEVTQAQWRAVMGNNPSNCEYGCGDEMPVQSVSWLNAVDYLNRLSQLEELTACYNVTGDQVSWRRSCTGYRLPTEAEWEYAARAGTQTAYSFGDDAAELDKYAWHRGNADGRVHDVGTKGQNPWGFHDMHGNVWEWAWDWYAEQYSTDVTENPRGPEVGEYRALRGGSFDFRAGNLRSALRDWNLPSGRDGYLGFRCARGAPQR